MKRALVLLLVCVLVACLAATASAGKRPKRTTRTAEDVYVVSLGTEPGPSPFWIGSPVGNITAVEFPLGAGERYVSVELADDSGLPVVGTIGADLDGTPQTLETVATFCSATPEPVELPPVAAIRVVAKSGMCDGEPGVATSGTITATFSNLP
ncbi:MAG: hypothetical protein M3273_02340 [Actinomycetota bacterium]|nr:hypothetical protein [Actinomycetota bacterium]